MGLNLQQNGGGGGGTTVNTIAKVSHLWIDSFTAATGNFTASQPAFSDLSGGLALSQNTTPSVGVIFFDDFVGGLLTSGNIGALGWGTSSSGTGGAISIPGQDLNTLGTLQLQTGSASTNLSEIFLPP